MGQFKFTVPPTIFNPKEYISSEIFVDFIDSMDSLEGKHVLDMGCGSGVVSVFAASKGAKCFAVDINPMGAKAAMQNALRNGLSGNVEALESNLFQKVDTAKKFDIMFFNPPYFKGIPRSNFEQAFKGGEDYEVIRAFINESKSYLNPGGEIYFITSSDMEINLLEEIFRAEGFEFILLKKIEKLLETFYITKSFLIR